jgi:hypothetical protein
MMKLFHGIPIFSSDSAAQEDSHVLVLENLDTDRSKIRNGIEQNKLVIIRAAPFEKAGALFRELTEDYGLADSYDLQMQYVVHLMKDRAPVNDVAVTVNERGPLQFVQPHAEGDSTSQLELFALHCVQNSQSGGENILSLIDQTADHSRLRAKEKAILGSGLSAAEIANLRKEHMDANEILSACSSICRVLNETQRGSVIVRLVPITPAKSAVTGESLVTYWDNVTVHDHAFHRHHYDLLRHLEILHEDSGKGYESYMHVEDDSPWGPADTDSGDVDRTAKLFRCHVLHRMGPNELLLFNNRIWTHAVNNWPAGQVRKLTAMYA